ncbi:hypothetical protein OG21DRAFT_417058 [Imleria badia]|nr:hypothetical protein OG21DRAFT_417058 [Imleria badia]
MASTHRGSLLAWFTIHHRDYGLSSCRISSPIHLQHALVRSSKKLPSSIHRHRIHLPLRSPSSSSFDGPDSPTSLMVQPHSTYRRRGSVLRRIPRPPSSPPHRAPHSPARPRPPRPHPSPVVPPKQTIRARSRPRSAPTMGIHTVALSARIRMCSPHPPKTRHVYQMGSLTPVPPSSPTSLHRHAHAATTTLRASSTPPKDGRRLQNWRGDWVFVVDVSIVLPFPFSSSLCLLLLCLLSTSWRLLEGRVPHSCWPCMRALRWHRHQMSTFTFMSRVEQLREILFPPTSHSLVGPT